MVSGTRGYMSGTTLMPEPAVSVVFTLGCVIDSTWSPFTPGMSCRSASVMRSTFCTVAGSSKIVPCFTSTTISTVLAVPNMLRYCW